MTSAAQGVPRNGRPVGAGRVLGADTWLRVRRANWPYRLLTLVLFAVAWQWWATERDSLLIPTFTETVAAFVKLVTNPATWQQFGVSNGALVVGFLVALAAGVPIGLMMGRFRAAEQFTDVYVNILLVTPMAALIPILLMSVGIDFSARVIVVVLFSVPMIIVNSRAGVRQVDPHQIEMARSFGAGERQIWRRVLLPGALPAVMTGVRIGLGRAVTGMVIVELLLVSVGIGRLILRFQSTFRPAELYAVVILVVMEALLLISIARWLERRASAWSTSASAFKE
jgi:ABC-type nitrate/sulfonate/bicarbonate transport system permease component